MNINNKRMVQLVEFWQKVHLICLACADLGKSQVAIGVFKITNTDQTQEAIRPPGCPIASPGLSVWPAAQVDDYKTLAGPSQHDIIFWIPTYIYT